MEIILVTLMPNGHVAEHTSDQGTDQPTDTEKTRNLDHGNGAALLNSDAESHPVYADMFIVQESDRKA